MCIFFQFLPHISTSMSLKSFVYILLNFLNFIYRQYCYQLYYSYFFCFSFSLNIFYLLKCAKRIIHKLNKLMKSSPIYNKLLCRNKKKIPLWSLFLIVYLHLQWNAVLTQIMLCLAEAVLRNSRFFCMNPYWISTRKVKKTCEGPSFKLTWEPLIFQQNIYRRKIPQQCYRNWPNLSRQLEWGL